MIRPIDIRLNAAHPELPLAEAVTFTGSPSTVLIRGVPPNCGRWAITAVCAAATFPDGTLATRAAVQSANGVWVATLPATATSGRTACGLRVMADGTDENGNAVTGYILGVADFAVCSLAVAPAPEPGGTGYWMRYFDSAPGVVKKGDVTKISGALVIYNGTAWEAFDARAYAAAEAANANANGIRDTLSTDYYTAEQTNEAIDRIAAYYITYNAAGAAFPTRADLLNAQTYYSGGVARTPTRNDYAVVLADETHDGAEYRYIYAVADGATTGQWEAQYPVEGVITFDDSVTRTSTNGVKSSGIWSAIWGALSALPTGFSSLYDWCVSQLAGKLDSTSAAPAWVSGTAYAADALVSYNGVVYRCKASTVSPHTATPDADTTHWEAKKVSELFLPLAGGTMTGPLTARNGIVVGLVAGNDFDGFKVNTNGIAMMTNHAGGQSTFGEILSAVQDVPDKANRASNPTAGNLAALDAQGNPTDAGYHFEVRNGIPCIVQYT